MLQIDSEVVDDSKICLFSTMSIQPTKYGVPARKGVKRHAKHSVAHGPLYYILTSPIL